MIVKNDTIYIYTFSLSNCISTIIFTVNTSNTVSVNDVSYRYRLFRRRKKKRNLSTQLRSMRGKKK